MKIILKTDKRNDPDFFFVLNQISLLYEVPLHVFDGDQCVYQPANLIQTADPLIYDPKLLQVLIGKWTDYPFLELEHGSVLYGICKTPHRIACVVGPVAIAPLSAGLLHQYKTEHGLGAMNDYSLTRGNLVKTSAVLALVHRELTGCSVDSLEILEAFYTVYGKDKVSEKDIFHYNFDTIKSDTEHLSYKVEKMILQSIKDGNSNALRDSFNFDFDMYEQIGVMAKTAFKQVEYATVSGITLFTRSAIEGGLDPMEAYRISDLYLQKIANCSNVMELQKLSSDAHQDFCIRVQNAVSKLQSHKYVKQCKQYVTNHLNKPLRLEDIAKAVGVNKCYLTHEFSKHEGIRLKTYIQQERVNAAQNMLKFSDESLSNISNYLCFHSQSHFGSTFKKITGMTPAAYRTKEQVI